jgi:hypothetical protein
MISVRMLRTHIDEDELLEAIRQRWDDVQDDAYFVQPEDGEDTITPENFLEVLLSRAAERLGKSEQGAGTNLKITNAQLRLEVEPSAEATVTHPTHGTTTVFVPGIAALVGQVNYQYDFKTHLFVKWVSHPFHQYAQRTTSEYPRAGVPKRRIASGTAGAEGSIGTSCAKKQDAGR